MTATRICFRCNENETTSALCTDCKAEVRAERAAANAPVWEERRAKAERETARQREAWNAVLSGRRMQQMSGSPA